MSNDTQTWVEEAAPVSQEAWDKLNQFKYFPKNAVCLICKTNDNKACMLLGIDGTDKGSIEQAMPVHTECLINRTFRCGPECNIIYTTI